MTDQSDLESIYREAQFALKSRDYVRASELLRQILVIDENYKDVSRLLAQTVKLKRRRWHNDPRLWGTVGFVIIVALGFFIAPRIRGLYALQPTVPVVINSPTATLPPTAIITATETPLPIPTAIPLTWKRVSVGQEFERDTISAFVIDPKDQDVLYAGMKNAGIYKSIDGGISWAPSYRGIANAKINSLTIDPQNANILYAGTEAGIFQTEDGGENWNRIGEGIYLIMDLQDNTHLYAHDGDYIYESTDRGKNWETVYSSKEGCPGASRSLAIHPTDGKTLFMGAGETCEPGLYQSSDGGHTWMLKVKSEYCLDGLVVGLDGQGNYYVRNFCAEGFESVTTSGVVYFYCDTHLCKHNPGEEYRIVTLGKPDVGTFTSITVSSYDPNTIYVGGEGLAVSKDGGLTWTKLNNGLGSEKLYLDTGAGDTPVLYLQSGECEGVHRTKQKKYYEGAFQDDARQPLYISANGGQTWELSLQNGCYLLKDANDIPLYRVGQDWTWMIGGGHLRRWLWLSQDRGKTWQGAYILDIGGGFTAVADPLQSGLLYVYSPDSFYMVGPGGEKKMISVDYGRNWKTVDSTESTKPCYGSTPRFIDRYRPMEIDSGDGNHVLFIDTGRLRESRDSCESSNTVEVQPPYPLNDVAIDPNNPEIIYVGADSGAYISYDAGATWGQVNDGLLGATVVYSIVVDKDSNVYAATPYGVFKLESK